MIRKTVVFFGVAILSGCVTQKPVYLPDGRQGFAISCDGTGLNWQDCFERAGEICKSAGYDLFTQNGDTSTIVSATPALLTATPVIRRSMLVGCKPAKSE